MSRIRILSEHLANQIAAGEVVERPASVVKELLENSLDAGATRVFVEVEGSGTRLIRVVDNGEGMDEDDVLLSIERHATSKLTEESRLNDIVTLGFRGEALPSIGSVSRLTLLSRLQSRESGTKAEIRYGSLHAVHEDGCAKGTIVEVRNLFGNVPARKKFLKSARTEQYHIEEVVRNQSLANIDTAFTLKVENRTVLDLPATGDLKQRVRAVYRYKGALLPVSSADGGNDLRVSGYLLEPESSSSRTNKLRVLVNGRPVQDRMIRHATAEGLQGFLMKGHSPSGVLFLELPPQQVDINVHPAKQEIRFRRAQDVHRLVVQTVAESIRDYQEHVRSEIFSVPEPSVAAPRQHSEPSPGHSTPAYQDSSLPEMERNFVSRVSGKIYPVENVAESEPVFQAQLDRPAPFAATGENGERLTDFSGLSLVGQLFNLYLLCEKDDQLIVIDQHAVHERILYQQLLREYQEQKIPRQNLMFPVSVEVRPEQAETLEKFGEEIRHLGFGVSHFGEETWVIKSVPALVGYLEPAALLFETVDNLRSRPDQGMSGPVPSRIDHLLSSMACKAAVKAGDKLGPEEMLALLSQMQESTFFSHCPHGRPVVKIFSKREIEKWFYRG